MDTSEQSNSIKKETQAGYWFSPITAEKVAQGFNQYSFLSWDGDDLYWMEIRPSEKGRGVLMCASPGQKTQEKTPHNYNVRTRVHEYGGRAYCVNQGVIYFVNFEDQRLYRQLDDKIIPLTNGAVRIAEPLMTPYGIVAMALLTN